MKIYAFDVRDDEVTYFETLSKKFQVEIELHSESLTAEMIPQLERGSAITILGLCEYGQTELDLLKEQEIYYLTTRSIGYNNIDTKYAKEIGLHFCNADYDPASVADYTVMMILLCLRNYKQALWRTNVNDYSLTGLMGREMRDLTIGIMGTGRIGATVARNLSGFGCRLLAYDKYENDSIKDIVTYVSMEDIYRECDVISLHMPLLEETYHIIDHEAISKMKDGVILINCARGSLIDIESLIANIESEKIGALGLDCLENEEEIVHKDLRTDIIQNREMAYLRQFKNVVHTQHMAFYTDRAVESMVECGVCGLIEMASGKKYRTQLF